MIVEEFVSVSSKDTGGSDVKLHNTPYQQQ